MFKKIFFTFIIFSLLAMNFAWVGVAKAVPAPYFKLTASQGQGGGSNEFYVGRCFEVEIYLNTNGTNTNGADVEINYDSSILQAVQSNCSSSAITVYTDGLFDVYPGAGNSISTSTILLSAYNNPGTSTNVSNGLYGHLFFKVLTASSSYDLNFEYTQDLTTDTNLAQTGGDGSDILLSVENLNLSLLEDTDNPVIDTKSPSSGATGIAVNSTVSFRLYDAMAGIDSSSAVVRMKESGGSYYTQSASIGSSLSTNETRYYQYSGSFNPNSNIKTNSGYYEYATSYTVEVSADDLGSASTHSTTTEWSFTTEDDTNAPYITNFSPTDGSSGVAVTSNVSFRVKDYKSNGGTIPGLGVDEDTIAIVLNSASLGTLNYTCSSGVVTCDISNPNSVLVTINPASDFAENEAVSVDIGASDLHSSANAMTTSSYSFTTEDTAPPTISGFTPTANSTGSASSTNISFHIVDGGSGVAIEYLDVYVNNDNYTAISSEVTVTGDASDYLIVIDPVSNFTVDQAVVVRISVQDQASTPNVISPNPTLYNFIVGLESTTPTCPTCGGGGGIMYIEKECPEVECAVCKEPEQLVCPETISPNCPVCPIVDTSSGGSLIPVVDEQTGGSISTGVDTAGTPTMVLPTFENKLPTKINLEKINDKVLSAKKFLLFSEIEENFILSGTSDAEEGNLLPFMIYGKDKNLGDKPLVFHKAVDKSGNFYLKIKNIFTPGSYNINSFIYNKDGKLIETKIGSFEVQEYKVIPLRTEEEQTKMERTFNYSTILVFLMIIAISLSVLFFTKSLAGSVGFASTFVVAILGIVVVTMYSNNKAIIIEKSAIEKEIQQTDTKGEYQDLLEQTKKTYDILEKQLINPIDDSPINGAKVEVGDQASNTDEVGRFTLYNINSTDKLKITSADFDQPIYLEVNNLSNEIIYLSPSLLRSLSGIELAQKQRKFKQVYPQSAQDVKDIIDQDTFVQGQNLALLDRIKQIKIADSGFDPNMQLLDTWNSPNTGKTYQDVAKVDFVYSGFNNTQGVVNLREPWYFVQENGEWRFLR
ncbi:Ig-like domain-containing protein [Patescibacteria group bacterium]|nr:Ig-like domain-containing protein [Patescibacteria group bacterium]